MSLPDRLEQALRRLGAALDQLDAATARRAGSEIARANLEEELAIMQDDRSRLAVELDGALARVRAFEQVQGEATRRLERANAAIRSVLSAAGDEAKV